MRCCDYCGGKLGLVVQRKWRLRFCRLVCKESHERRQRQKTLLRSGWVGLSMLKSALRANLHRRSAVRERVGFGLVVLNLICNPLDLRNASGSIAEYFYQRLAPAVESAPLDDLDGVHGIGIRLIRDGRVAHNSTQRWDWPYEPWADRVGRL